MEEKIKDVHGRICMLMLPEHKVSIPEYSLKGDSFMDRTKMKLIPVICSSCL